MRAGADVGHRGSFVARRRAAWIRLALVAVALSLVGCLQLGARCPSSRGERWRALESAHFVLKTDLGSSEARAAIAGFEATWTALRDAAFAEARAVPPRITVVIFSREADFREVEPCGIGGAFYARLPHDLEDEPTIVLGGAPDPRMRRAFAHELTHAFARRSWGAIPPWFNEGLAELLSGLELEPDGTVILGRRAPGAPPRACALPPVPDLLAADRSRFYAGARYGDPSLEGTWREQAYYAGSSALVSMLLTDPSFRARGHALVLALDRGERFCDAWHAAFGDATAALDTELRASVKRGGSWPIAIRTRARTDTPSAATEHPLGHAEAHLLFARLVPWEGAPGERAAADLEAARRADPESPEVAYVSALFALAHGRYDAAERLLLDAMRRAPSDGALVHALATTYESRLATEPTSSVREKLAVAVDRLRTLATRPAALELVAAYDASVGRVDEGLAFARRALAADPASWRALETYAGLLHQAGRLEEAVEAQERAIAALPDSVDAAALTVGLEQYRDDLRRLRVAPVP